jgi:hypothetical protein
MNTRGYNRMRRRNRGQGRRENIDEMEKKNKENGKTRRKQV